MGCSICLNPPYQYTMAMCTKYSPENRHLYFPKPPREPHRNTIKTPEDYPSEAERQAVAEQKRLEKEEKKKKQLAEEGVEADQGTSKLKRRRLPKKYASPPPATTEDDRAHAVVVEAA